MGAWWTGGAHGHLEHGMQVVTKPFDMGDLTRRIQTIIADD